MKQTSRTTRVTIGLLLCCMAIINAENVEREFGPRLKKGIALFDSAYNAWNDSLFLEAYAHFSKMQRSFPAQYFPRYWQGVVSFYLVSYTLFGLPEDRDQKAAALYVAQALDALNEALELKPGDAEALALLGTLKGIKIYLNPLLAPVLGPQVMNAIERALEAGPDNPRVYYLVGVSYYNTPSFLGGGAAKGLDYLLKAHELFAGEAKRPDNPLSPDWGYSTCLAFIGKVYMSEKEYEKARIWFNNALVVNPQDKLAKRGIRELARIAP
ncbi:MAG: hypothetical protein GF401_13785 [Chitinivibrionales bacterium]|nr:hypothetical protein [Chitinivibrionales bacterium]